MPHMSPARLALGLLLLAGALPGSGQADQGTTADVEPESKGILGVPGEQLNLNYTLANHGPAPATYNIDAQLPHPWKAWTDSPSIDVPPQGSRTLTVKVSVPPDSTRLDSASGTITATNAALNSDFDKVSFKVGAEPGAPRVRAWAEPANVSLAPGEVAAWRIHVKNEAEYWEPVRVDLSAPTTGHSHGDLPPALAPRATESFDVRLKIPGDAPPGNRTLTAIVEVPGVNGTMIHVPLRAEVVAPAAAVPEAPPPRFEAGRSRSMLPAIALSLSVPLVASLAWEGIRARLALLLVALFSRLDQSRVLDHERRNRILQAINANPGIHFGELRRLFELGNGTLAHHLRMLRNHRLIRARHDGFRLRHYPAGGPIDPGAWLSEAQRRIAVAVQARPGLRMRDLSQSLSLSRQVVNYHVQRLVRLGHLRAERDGLRPRYFPSRPERPT